MSISQVDPSDGNDYLLELTSQTSSLAASAGDDGGGFGIGSGGYRQPQFEGGEIENEPEVRLDVVRESDQRAEEELPEQGIARSLLTHFKDIEAEAQHTKQKEHRPSGVAVKATPTPLRPAVRTEGSDSNDSYGPPAQERAEVENEPIVRTDVVKESDSNVAEELPERGMARNLLSKFQNLEVEAKQRSDYKPSGVSARNWKGSPARSTSAEPHREPVFEGGDVENTPQVRTDVVRESDSNIGEELPEPGTAQSLLSRFKTLENEATKKSEYKPSGVANKATPSKMHIMAGRSTYIPDGTTKGGNVENADIVNSSAAFEPQFEGGEFENTPEVRSDVIRESDRIIEEDLPQQGLAKNLLSRFKSIEAEASVKKDYVPSGVGSKPTPTPLGLAATAVGIRRPASQHDGSSDSRGASSEREHTPSSYGELEASAVKGGEYENVPAPRPDGIVGASDHDDRDDLPESGLAQSMLSKFKSLESQKIADYQPSGVGSKAADDPAALVGTAHSEHNVAAGLSRTLHPLPLPGAQAPASSSGSSCVDRQEETTVAMPEAASAAVLYVDDELYAEAGKNRPASVESRSTWHEPEQAIASSPDPAVAQTTLGGTVSSGQPVHAYIDLSSSKSWTGSIRTLADDVTNDHCAAADASQCEVSLALQSDKVEIAAVSPPESSTLHADSILLPDPAVAFLPTFFDERNSANAEALAFSSSFASEQQTCINPACSSPATALPMNGTKPSGNAALFSSFGSGVSAVTYPASIRGSSPNEVRMPESTALAPRLEGESQLECGNKVRLASSISADIVATDVGIACGIQSTSISSESQQQCFSICNDTKIDGAESEKFMPVAPKSLLVAAEEFPQNNDISGWELGIDLSSSHGATGTVTAKTDEHPTGAASFGKSEIACRCSELDSDAALCPGVILDVLTYGSAAADLCSLCAARPNKCGVPVYSVQTVSPSMSSQATPDLQVQSVTKSNSSDADYSSRDAAIGSNTLPPACTDHSEISGRFEQVQIDDNSDKIVKDVVLDDCIKLPIPDAAAAKSDMSSSNDRSSPVRSPLHAALPLSLMLPTICNGVILRPAVNSSQDTEQLIRFGSPRIDSQEGVAEVAFEATDDSRVDSRQANPESSIAEEHDEVICLTTMTAEPCPLPCLLYERSNEQPRGQLNINALGSFPIESVPEISRRSNPVADSQAVLGDVEKVANNKACTAVSHFSSSSEGTMEGTVREVDNDQLLPNKATSCDAVQRGCDEAAYTGPQSMGHGDSTTEGSAVTASTPAGDITFHCGTVFREHGTLLNADQPIACTMMSAQKSDIQSLPSCVASTVGDSTAQKVSNENSLQSGSDGQPMTQIATSSVTTTGDLPPVEYRTSVCTTLTASCSSTHIDQKWFNLGANSTSCTGVPTGPSSGSPDSSIAVDTPPCPVLFEAANAIISSDGTACAEFLSSGFPKENDGDRVAERLPLLPEPSLALEAATVLSAVTVPADSKVQVHGDDVMRQPFSSVECSDFSSVPTTAAEKQHMAVAVTMHSDQDYSNNADRTSTDTIDSSRATIMTDIFTDKQSVNPNLSCSEEINIVTTPDHHALPGLTDVDRLDLPPCIEPRIDKAVNARTTASEVAYAAFDALQAIGSDISEHQQSTKENLASSTELEFSPDQQSLCSAIGTRCTSDDTNMSTGAPERPISSTSIIVPDATADTAPVALATNDSATLTSPAVLQLLPADSGDSVVLQFPVHSGSPLHTEGESLRKQLSENFVAPAEEPNLTQNRLCAVVDVCDLAPRHSVFHEGQRMYCSAEAVLSNTSVQLVSQRLDSPSTHELLFDTVSSTPSPVVCEEAVERLPASQPSAYDDVAKLVGPAREPAAACVDPTCRQSTVVAGDKKGDIAASVECSLNIVADLPWQAVERYSSSSSLVSSQAVLLEARTVRPSEGAVGGNNAAIVTCFPALDVVSRNQCFDRPSPLDGSNKDSYGLSFKESSAFTNDGVSSRAVTGSNTDCSAAAIETPTVPAGHTTCGQDG